jgi:hypothetical protein
MYPFRAVIVGGNATNGSNAGLSYFNVNNAPSNRNVNIRSRFSLDKLIQPFFPCMPPSLALAKNRTVAA